jgi:hypothetical protein
MEIALPDLNMTPVKMLVSGDSVSVTQMGQTPALDEDAKKEILEAAKTFPELDFTGAGYKTELTSITNLDGKDAYEMKVTYPSGNVSTNYYEVSTGYKLRTVRVTRQGATLTVDYSDYRQVDGIWFPYHTINDQGQVVLDLTVQSIKVNSGLADADFK